MCFESMLSAFVVFSSLDCTKATIHESCSGPKLWWDHTQHTTSPRHLWPLPLCSEPTLNSLLGAAELLRGLRCNNCTSWAPVVSEDDCVSHVSGVPQEGRKEGGAWQSGQDTHVSTYVYTCRGTCAPYPNLLYVIFICNCCSVCSTLFLPL